ncbi:MAG TPA: PAS domain-containing sensor histidine kinase [Flavisolibacter sp.]|jgi:PAS domain S-box-containing protein|nr:PAS domain-containing sensor histidine kinase [Flavisolibacter sp.]
MIPGRLYFSDTKTIYELFMHYHSDNEIYLNKDFTSQVEDKRILQWKGSADKQREKEELLQTLVENSFDLLGLLDENGNYLYVAESTQNGLQGTKESLLGYHPEDLIGKPSFAFFHPDDLPPLTEQFSLLFNGVKKIHVPPYRFRDASGRWRWMEAIVTNQLDNPEIHAIVVSCRDVSRQKEMEARLNELVALKAQMEGEEKERSRIARDLHDSVANLIAAAKMQLSALADSVQEVKARQEFLQSLDLLDNAAMQVRNTSHNLKQEPLLEKGLDGALQRYCQSFCNSKISVEFVSIGTSRRFPEAFELSIYRICQELIGNAIKHAKATHVLVQLSFHEDHLGLAIEDNGRGFNLQQETKGTGLKSVQKRVKALNGKMEIQTRLDKGTCIYIGFDL